MTISGSLFESYYSTDWTDSVQSSQQHFIFPLHDHAKIDAESMQTLFAPSAGALYVYRPSKRRRILIELLIDLNKATCLATNTPYPIYAISTAVI